MTSITTRRVALIGAGRVGVAVAHLLQESDVEIVGVSSRSARSQGAAARRLSSPEFDYRTALPAADIMLLGVIDAALDEVVDAVTPHLADGTYVCHFSGSVGTRPLDKVRASGARPCALHPVQAFPDVDAALARLPGSTWGVTCDTDDRPWADEFVERFLKGRPVHVREDDRPVWHAAAVMVSNGISALLSIGESLLSAIGVDEPNVALAPIATGTVVNAREGGGGAATLTGPVVRGESFIIRRHLERLGDEDPELVNAYAQVVAMIIEAARASGRIEPAVAEEIAHTVSLR